jgi:hypothetical protein
MKKIVASWLCKLLGWLLAAIGFLCKSLLVVWATLAIYFSRLPWAWSRLVLAVAFAAFGIWASWLTRRPRMRWAFAGLFLVVLVGFLSIRPSQDRPWRPEVAVMPRAIVDGDRVRFSGFRFFDYRSTDDFTARYEEREVLLSHLAGVDFFLSYWKRGPVAHTFVSFCFDNAPPVCISIEVRTEVHEAFAPVASLFKQSELIYVVGDERDLLRVRTNYREEEVYLYRIRTSPKRARRLFLVYLDRINELADRPEFYNLLSNNCTVNIVRAANAAGRDGGFDIRYLLNGLIDRSLYEVGVVNITLPFEELRRRSRIDEAGRSAENASDFSERIRASLPPPAVNGYLPARR